MEQEELGTGEFGAWLRSSGLGNGKTQTPLERVKSDYTVSDSLNPTKHIITVLSKV